MKFQEIKFNRMIRYLPMLAPITEGYAIYNAIGRELDWHPFFVLVAALTVALTGFWGVQVMNAMSEFNATLRKQEQAEFVRLPTWKAVSILAVWFSGVTLLTVFLDVWPVLRDWTPLGLVVIGFSAAYLFSLSNLCETREQERVAYRQKLARQKEESASERKNQRNQRKAHRQEIATKKQEIRARLQGKGVALQEKSGSKLTDAMLLLEWSIDPGLTPTRMAQKLMEDGTVESVTRQAIEGRLKSMIQKGLVIRTQDGLVHEVIFEDGKSRGGSE